MVSGSPFRLGAGALAVSTENRWLLVFSIVAAVVLGAGTLARRAARRQSDGNGNGGTASRGIRRRAGVLLALGPLIGLALAPSPDTLTVVAAVGAAALAAVGVVVERAAHADRLTMAATVIAAAVAVIAGARFGPTGVDALDVVFAFCFIVVVTEAADGFGNVDGLATGIGAASAAGLFALAGFGGQDDLATVALGLLASCFAFLAFNLRPASLFVGRAGRLAIGYTLAVGVLAVQVVPSAPRELITPPMLVGVLLVDAAVVAVDRLRRRHPLSRASVRPSRAPAGRARLVAGRSGDPARARAGRAVGDRSVHRPCGDGDVAGRRPRRGRGARARRRSRTGTARTRPRAGVQPHG